MSKCTNCGDLIPRESEVCLRCGAKKGSMLDKDFTKRLRIAGFPQTADKVELLQGELEQVKEERDALKKKLEAIERGAAEQKE